MIAAELIPTIFGVPRRTSKKFDEIRKERQSRIETTA